jgi:hypothetical protein
MSFLKMNGIGRFLLLALGAGVALLAGMGCEDLPLYAPPGATMMVTASDPIIAADGVATTEVVARIVPREGIVADGTQVVFSTTLGTLSNDVVLTDDGVASTTLRSSQIEGTARVSALSGTVSDSVSVQIGYSVETVVLFAEPAVHELAAGESKLLTSEIKATVTDRNDNRVARKVVTFAADEGRITGGDTVVTDDLGEARATFEIQINASELVGEKLVNINATAGGVIGTVGVRIRPL